MVFKIKKIDLIICSALVIIGFNILVYNLDAKTLYWDEVYTTYVSRKAPLEIINHLYSIKTNPPLFYLISHPIVINYNSDFIIRLIPLTFGLLSIIAIYFFNLSINNRATALLSATLLMILPYFILYSKFFKMYTLFTLLSILSYHFFFKILYRKKGKNDNKYFIISNVLGLYTHSWFALLVLTEFLVFIIFYLFKKIKFKKMLINFFIIALFFLPWIPNYISALSIRYNIDSQSSINFLEFFNVYFRDYDFFFSILLFIPIGILIIKKEYRKFALYLLLFIPLIILYTTNYNFYSGDFRYFLFLLPLCITLISITLSNIRLPNIKLLQKKGTLVNAINILIYSVLLIYILNYILIPATSAYLGGTVHWVRHEQFMAEFLEENVKENDAISINDGSLKEIVEWYSSERLKEMINQPTGNLDKNGTLWFIIPNSGDFYEIMRNFQPINQNISQANSLGCTNFGSIIAQPINLTNPSISLIEIRFSKSHKTPDYNLTLEIHRDLNNKPSGEIVHNKSFKPIESSINKIYLNLNNLNTSEQYWLVFKPEEKSDSGYTIVTYKKESGNALVWIKGWFKWEGQDVSYEIYYNNTDDLSEKRVFSDIFRFGNFNVYKASRTNRKIEIPVTEGNWSLELNGPALLINSNSFSNISLRKLEYDGYLFPTMDRELGEIEYFLKSKDNSVIKEISLNVITCVPYNKSFVKILVFNNSNLIDECTIVGGGHVDVRGEHISLKDALLTLKDLNLTQVTLKFQVYADSDKPIYLGVNEDVKLKLSKLEFNVTSL